MGVMHTASNHGAGSGNLLLRKPGRAMAWGVGHHDGKEEGATFFSGALLGPKLFLGHYMAIMLSSLFLSEGDSN